MDNILTNHEGFLYRRMSTGDHGGEEVQVRDLTKKVNLSINQKGVKVMNDRPMAQIYDIAALPIEYRIGSTVHDLWLIVPRNRRQVGTATCS